MKIYIFISHLILRKEASVVSRDPRVVIPSANGWLNTFTRMVQHDRTIRIEHCRVVDEHHGKLTIALLAGLFDCRL